MTRTWKQSWAVGAILAGAIIVHGGNTARAQVNTQTLERDRAKEGWSGSVSGSLTLARGNVELLDAGGAGDLQYLTLWPGDSASPLPWVAQRLSVNSNAHYAERSDIAFLSNTFTHARWTAMWHRRIGSEVFLQHQYNKFLRLRLRALAGTGARAVLVNRKEWILAFGSGYMLELERINVADGADDDSETRNHRWSNYLTGRVELIEGRLLVQDTAYFQPRFDKPDDYRLLNDLELVLPISKRLSFTSSLRLLYDSEPPTGVETTDLGFYQSVTISL